MDSNLADKVGELSKEVKHLTNIVGKCANALTSINIEEYMGEYQGAERRKENIDFQVFMAETVIYRKMQQEKQEELKNAIIESNKVFVEEIKNLTGSLSQLPCRTHSNEMKWLRRVTIGLTTIVIGIGLRIIYMWIERK